MSDNFNDLLLILNLPTDGSILISKVEVLEDTKFIHISTSPSPVFCPNCGCRMHSKGMYARTVNLLSFRIPSSLFLLSISGNGNVLPALPT